MVYMPPEVIARQLTSGWGPEQMQAAAVSFGNLAKAYQDLSIRMEAHSRKVLSNWTSSTSLPLQEKISQFVAQLQTYATILADSSARADAQDQIFTNAWNSIVHLPQIVANRSAVASLQEKNFYGQNNAEIARLQAVYAQYAAQNNTAMQAYRAGTEANTGFRPVTEPPPLASAGTLDAEQSFGGIPGRGVDEPQIPHSPGEFAALPGGMPVPAEGPLSGSTTSLAASPGLAPSASPTLAGLAGDGFNNPAPLRGERATSTADLSNASGEAGIRYPAGWKAAPPDSAAARTPGLDPSVAEPNVSPVAAGMRTPASLASDRSKSVGKTGNNPGHTSKSVKKPESPAEVQRALNRTARTIARIMAQTPGTPTAPGSPEFRLSSRSPLDTQSLEGTPVPVKFSSKRADDGGYRKTPDQGGKSAK